MKKRTLLDISFSAVITVLFAFFRMISFIFAVMKLFSILMAIVVMSLSLRPCCDAVDSKKTAQIASNDGCCDDDACTENSAAGNQCQDDNSCKSACSPFFTCGSCAGITVQYAQFNLVPSLPLISESAPLFFDEQFRSEYFNTKWQPPKIG